jgi:hypothetical protein
VKFHLDHDMREVNNVSTARNEGLNDSDSFAGCERPVVDENGADEKEPREHHALYEFDVLLGSYSVLHGLQVRVAEDFCVHPERLLDV